MSVTLQFVFRKYHRMLLVRGHWTQSPFFGMQMQHFFLVNCFFSQAEPIVAFVSVAHRRTISKAETPFAMRMYVMERMSACGAQKTTEQVWARYTLPQFGSRRQTISEIASRCSISVPTGRSYSSWMVLAGWYSHSRGGGRQHRNEKNKKPESTGNSAQVHPKRAKLSQVKAHKQARMQTKNGPRHISR